MASGAQRREPMRPRNLSIFDARQTAKKMAAVTTRKRDRFCSQ